MRRRISDEPPVVAECVHCAGEIRVGDEVARSTEGDVVHADCWDAFATKIYRDVIGIITIRGEIE